MIKEKQREGFLVLGLILAIFFSCLPVIYTHFYHDITSAPEAINGSMDLSSVSTADGNIYLDGQWEFYWNRFIVTEPEKLPKPDLIISVPDSWSNYRIDGERLPSEGYGSYKLTFTGLTYENTITLHIPDFGGAYRVFIDGQLTSESGIASKDKDELFIVPKADLYPVTLSTGMKHEAVIEVATTRFSGLYMTPVMGDFHKTVNDNNARNAVRFIMFGVALFSFISLLAIYTVNIRRKFYSFWLPVMIVFILARIMLTSEFYSIWQPVLFFNLSYESTNEMMYLTTFVLKYLLLFLVEEQCGITFIKREKIGFLAYYILLYLIYLLVPQSIYNQHLSVLVPMLTYVLDVYLFIKIYCGRQTLKKFGMAIFWSTVIVIVGLAIDSYYINGKIYMNMSLTLLFLFTVFSLIMSCVYAMRVGILYDDFSISSSQLEMANNQIAMQKEYYDTLIGQMDKIREMKHDIRHFIGAMSRLAEESKFDELKMFLGEYGEKTEMEQLPIFCEHTIANSIIGYYYMRAKENGISFESKCHIGKQSIMSDSDICIVLGNALENAVYASKQMANGYRCVSIEAATMKKQLLIKVRNSHNGCPKVSDGHFVSTKGGKSHGLGIQNIDKVMESYGGFVKIEYDEKEFTLMAAVPEK